ncbi:hypothetical protein AAFF_G00234700 [Aldrovandia affinis]|uniref:Uncharacterized protein n=1 Tax=Aldrovandia affinis TaxID=143900 RepID=A0AAD7WU28_9TELE|nr:hypothetical protein AAFF_G00234700 [Aldrovandia affinis]
MILSQVGLHKLKENTNDRFEQLCAGMVMDYEAMDTFGKGKHSAGAMQKSTSTKDTHSTETLRSPNGTSPYRAFLIRSGIWWSPTALLVRF